MTGATVRRVVVEADGGSRGNPGPAGYGAVVRDADTGQPLREAAAGIGVASNNVAEYRGLIAGLQTALDLGAREVDVRMDSKLVVEQMNGRWQVKHPDMKTLARQAAELVRRFDTVTFTHIRRELNKHADRLANEAMDAAARGQQWQPPDLDSAQTAVEVPEPEPEPELSRVLRPGALYGWGTPVGRPTVTVLLRHGETALSVEKRFSGRGDQPLTDTGVAQARAAAARLAAWPVEAVVSSPLRRARQTAGHVADALGVDVAVEDGFVETDFGDWEGYTFAEVRERWPDRLAAWLSDVDVAPPGGESFTQTFARVAAARRRLQASYDGRRVLVVSHVTPIKTMLRDAMDAPAHALYRLHLDLTSVSTVDWYADGPAVVRLVNDTSHLGPLPPAVQR